jgi:hypothetical protein
MATTQIKDGFNGGSDNQLKVNSDGSINVTGGGGTGGTVKIQDSNGNPITSTNGALNVEQVGFSTITPGYPTQISVGTSSTQLFAANPNRKYAHIVNNTSETIFIQFQVSAALNQGIKMNPGSFYTLESTNLWLGVVNAIGNLPSQLIDVLEGEI